MRNEETRAVSVDVPVLVLQVSMLQTRHSDNHKPLGAILMNEERIG